MRVKEGQRISQMKEWEVYTRQCILLLLNDFKNLAVSLGFPAVAVLITVWIAGENMFVHYDGTKSGCFVLVSAAIWGGLFNSIQVIVKERANIKREYITAGMRLRCYTASRAIVQFLLCAVQSAILSISFQGVHWKYDNVLPETGVVFDNVMLEYYITLLLLMYAADTMGLLISSIVKKSETANVMAPYILIVQLIFSGILFAMKGSAEKVSYLMLSRWGMEALGSTSNLNDMQLKIQLTVPTVPHEAEDMFLYTKEHLCEVWGILIIFILIFVTAANLFLHSVSKDSR